MYSKKTNMLLKQMVHCGCIDRDCFDNDTLKNLYQDKYIQNSGNYNDNNVYITDAGRGYIEDLIKSDLSEKFSRIHTWINTIVAILALLTAITALIVSIMQLNQLPMP